MQAMPIAGFDSSLVAEPPPPFSVKSAPVYSIFPDGVAVSMCSVSDRSEHYVAAAQALSRLERVVLAAAKPVHHTTAKVVAGEDVGQRASRRRDSADSTLDIRA